MKKIQLGHHTKWKRYKNPIMYALVDDEDFEELSKYNWHAYYNKNTRSFYAMRADWSSGNPCTIKMHRFIISTPKGLYTDHINHDTLDNRKQNLRIATASQNMANKRISKNNTSGFNGVIWHKARRKWQAQIGFNKKTVYLGLFDSKETAALTYNEKATILFGEFATLNVI